MSWRIGLLATVAVLSAAKTQAADLSSYEATYDLRLTHASSTTGPRAVVGTLESLFAQTCDGWETRSRLVVLLKFRDDTEMSNETLFSSWESKNSEKYKFTVRTFRNSEAEQAYSGSAALTKSGGRAQYDVPPVGKEKVRPVIVALPRGSLFPVAHSKALLSHAERGDILFSSVVLNGASYKGPRMMSTAIGPRVASQNIDASSAIDENLLDTHFWRMSTAIFGVDEKIEVPNFELAAQLHQSGVTESFEQTLGDFALAAKLTGLRRLPAPACVKR